MEITIIFLFLTSIINTQSCCSSPQVCPTNASCFCEGTINSCIYEIVEERIPFTLKQQQNYFNWVPSTPEYLSVTIIFCSEQTTQLNQKYKAGFKIQNKYGNGYPQNLNISFQVSGKGNCFEYQIASPKFCTSPSGGFCNMIISIIPLQKINENIYISVNYVQGLTKYIIYILIAIGSVLLMIVIILVACMIRKRMIGQQNQKQVQENKIDHLQFFLPKVKLKQMILNQTIPQDIYNCAVCLTQINQQQIVRKTHCGHIFHVDCVDLWCLRHLTCPMCRQSLDEQNLNKRTNNNQPVVLLIKQNIIKCQTSQVTLNVLQRQQMY